MSIKIESNFSLDQRRILLWRKFGKVVSRQLEFMKKFDARAYVTGLDAIEGIVQTNWIDIEKRNPKDMQKCIIELANGLTWGNYDAGKKGFNIHADAKNFAANIGQVKRWIPYPNDFK